MTNLQAYLLKYVFCLPFKPFSTLDTSYIYIYIYIHTHTHTHRCTHTHTHSIFSQNEPLNCKSDRVSSQQKNAAMANHVTHPKDIKQPIKLHMTWALTDCLISSISTLLSTLGSIHPSQTHSRLPWSFCMSCSLYLKHSSPDAMADSLYFSSLLKSLFLRATFLTILLLQPTSLESWVFPSPFYHFIFSTTLFYYIVQFTYFLRLLFIACPDP